MNGSRETLLLTKTQLPESEIDEGMRWARGPREHTQNVRNKRVQIAGFGIDVDRYLKGYALDTIIADDRNITSTIFLEQMGRQAGLSRCLLNEMRERLDWEIGMPEIPEIIKTELRDVLTKLDDKESVKLEADEHFRRIRKKRIKAGDRIEEITAKDLDLSSAWSYARGEVDNRIRKRLGVLRKI